MGTYTNIYFENEKFSINTKSYIFIRGKRKKIK